jgi:hypothetical protein
MEKKNFLEFLQRSSPNEVREFVMREGKKKLFCPIIEVPKKDEEKQEEKK